ncbi:MAG: LysR family transcriptional regulator [Acidobacteria bacterium]|nr:MAG: LysR family transcriptional regulator [Acidobacteriota bacterium]
MELHELRVFLEVASEKSFSRAAEKLFRPQPAVSLAVQRLESELEEKLIERGGRELLPTEAGRLVLDFARRFDNLERELVTSLAELRDRAAGRLVIGANESTTLYLLPHLCAYRRCYPRIKIQVQRCLSSNVPRQIVDGDLELGVISYEPDDGRLLASVLYKDHLAFVVSPRHRLARRRSVSITELGLETFIGHNVVSPYRIAVLREFQRHKVPLNREVEMPTLESVRRLVQQNEGVSFLPRMCVEQEIAQRSLAEVRVRELVVAREIRLVYPAHRTLSHAASAFM